MLQHEEYTEVRITPETGEHRLLDQLGTTTKTTEYQGHDTVPVQTLQQSSVQALLIIVG